MLQTLFRTLIIYFVILIVIRLMGKRELAQLSPFDFVVAIIIAELAALPIEEKNIPLYDAIFPILIVAILEIGVSYLAMKSTKARSYIYGHPTIVIANGKIIDRNMKKLRYNLNDLLTQLRDKGFFDIDEVYLAIVEVPGTLSIFPKAKHRAITNEDIQNHVKDFPLPMPLIVDGMVIEHNLKLLHKNKEWLSFQLSQKGVKLKEAFFVTYSDRKGLYISKKGTPNFSELINDKNSV